jgi:hypothetical protein
MSDIIPMQSYSPKFLDWDFVAAVNGCGSSDFTGPAGHPKGTVAQLKKSP